VNLPPGVFQLENMLSRANESKISRSWEPISFLVTGDPVENPLVDARPVANALHGRPLFLTARRKLARPAAKF